MHIKYDNLKVVTIRILTFLSGCILALLKVVCSPPKEDSCCGQMLVTCTGSKATVHLIERVCKFAMFAMFGQLIRKVYLICQHNS